MGGRIEILTINYDPKILLICNDVGKLKGLEANFLFNGDRIAGTVLFARGNAEGEIVGLEDSDLALIYRLTGV